MGTQPPPKRGTAAPTIFGPCLLWSNGWMDQDVTWYGGMLRSWPQCVRWGPTNPQRRTAAQFSAHVSCCGQTAEWIKMPLGTEVDLSPLCWGRASPGKGHSSPPSFRPISIVAKRSPISDTAELLLSMFMVELADLCVLYGGPCSINFIKSQNNFAVK